MVREKIDRTGTAPGWLRRLGPAGRAESGGDAQLAEQLEAELMLLREENARLKVERQRARDRPVSERVRELLPLQDDAAAGGPELLTDLGLLRDELVDACREIERGARDARARLEALQLAASEEPGARDGLERVA